MFIQIADGQPFGYPITNENFRMVIPSNVSIPQYPLTADILSLGFAVYEFAQKPDVPLSDFKVVEEGQPQWTNDAIRGDFITQVWSIRDMTQAEKDDAIAYQWSVIRADRNRRLYECDWTQLSDAPLTNEQKAEWVTYRQALRDVTSQSDPFAIVWPVKPE